MNCPTCHHALSAAARFCPKCGTPVPAIVDTLPAATQDADRIHAGNISGTGIAIGTGSRVDISITEEQAYKVAGLPNPYLGLRAFTDAERNIFAGRERIIRALVAKLSATDGERLLFIVGASGSGKSSVARAGVLPNLAETLRGAGFDVQTRIIEHPGRVPGTLLTRVLADVQAEAAISSRRFALILLDQAEELFTQAGTAEREQALAILANLATSDQRFFRIIATMRSDFLPHLVADPRFEQAEQRKFVLRAMNVHELRDAIQRPFSVLYPDKHMEPALVEQLATDAAADVAYLPLLQVTLEDLWRGGNLHLSAYNGLADAIQRRADAVYIFRDYDGLQQEPRSPDDQHVILDLFLSLVRVSLDEDQHVVRWRRARAEATHGDSQREQLVDDLASARLLRTDREIVQIDGHEIETVDIVHEAVLSGWPTLKGAIERERELIRRRVRFDLALSEWIDHEQQGDYLLTGVRLAEAEALKDRNDSIFQRTRALDFFVRSVRRRDQERQRQVRRARQVVAGLSVLALVAVLAAGTATWFGFQAGARETDAQNNAATAAAERDRADRNALDASNQKNTAVAEGQRADQQRATAETNRALAEEQSKLSLARQLAAQALTHFDDHFDLALLLALEADSTVPSSETRASLFTALQTSPFLETFLRGHSDAVVDVAVSHDGTTFVSVDKSGVIRTWDALTHQQRSSVTPKGIGAVTSSALSRDGHLAALGDENGEILLFDTTTAQPLREPFGPHTGKVARVAFSQDGSVLAAWDGSAITLWNTTTGEGRTLATDVKSAVTTMSFSPDMQLLVIGETYNTFSVWDVMSGQVRDHSVNAHQGQGSGSTAEIFSPDGSLIATGACSQGGPCIKGSVALWDVTTKQSRWPAIQAHRGIVTSLAFSSDGNLLATGGNDGVIMLWDVATGQATADPLKGHSAAITSLAFSPDGHTLVSGSVDKTVAVWDLSKRQALSKESGVIQTKNGMEIGKVGFSPDGTRLAWINSGGQPVVWNIATSQETVPAEPTFTLHTSPEPTMAFHPNARTLAIGEANGRIALWDTTTNSWNYLNAANEEAAVIGLAWTSDGKGLAAAYADRSVRIWSPEQGQTIGLPLIVDVDTSLLSDTDYTNPVALAFDQADASLTLASSYGIVVWDLTTHTQVRSVLLDPKLHGSTLLSPPALSPDRHLMAHHGGAQGIALIDTSNGNVIGTLSDEASTTALSLAFSPDGSLLASGDYDNSVTLWDVGTRQRIGSRLRSTNLWVTPGKFSPWIQSIVFSPDGEWIATGSHDQTVRLWDISIDHIHICALANRNFTDTEWRAVMGDATYHRTCPDLPDGQGAGN